jgi:hypothetical protein
MELHKARQVAFGPSALSISEITAWLDLKGIRDFEDRQECYELISAMDCAWLDWARTKQKQKEDQDANTKPRNRRT